MTIPHERAVRVPLPERYAVHKLMVSHEDALAAVPKSASKLIKLAKKALEQHLPDTATAAWEALA